MNPDKRPLSTAENRSEASAFARDLLASVAALVAYLALRAAVPDDRATAIAHAIDLLHFERTIGLDVEHGVQDIVNDRPTARTFFNAVYVWAYWPTFAASLIVLWFHRRRYFYRLRRGLIIAGLLGVAVMFVYPVAPPRMLPGFDDTVGQQAREHFVSRPSWMVNQYAALPSFHVGWIGLCTLVTAAAFRRRSLYALAALGTLAMAIAVISTSNHFFVDGVVGTGLSALGYVAATHRWDTSRARLNRPASPTSRWRSTR